MNKLSASKLIFTLAVLLLTNVLFSNNFNNNSKSNLKHKLNILTVDPITPTTGSAGTIVTINGTSFTSTSVVQLGTIEIPAANIQFVNATQLKVTLPCGLSDGYFSVDGISSTSYFTYTNPKISGGLSVCVGATTALSGSMTPAGNTPWQSSNLGIATITNTGLVSGITSGTTVITYTNSNGCSTTTNFVVNALPTVVITNPAPVCTPNTINLTSTTITSGSSANLSYSYYTDAAATTTVATPSAIATSGTYYIKGTDSNGCSTVKPVSVLINAAPTITVSGQNTICANENTILTASGGNGYFWNGGLGSTASITVNPATTTTYSVNGTDNNGCVGTASFTVTAKPLPTVSAGLDKNLCSGSFVTLTGTGSGVASYSWDNAVTDNVAFTALNTSTYTVTGQGTNGCFNTDSVLITVNPKPAAPISSATQPDCNSTTGSIQLSGLPTIGNWMINPINYNGSGSAYTISNVVSGVYDYSITDSNFCTSANSKITINAAPTIPSPPIIGYLTQPSCANPTGSVVLSGLPNGNWILTKSPGGQTYSNTGNTFTVTNLAPGTYTFSVSNGTCSSLASPNAVIDAIPTQSAPIDGLIVQPTCTTSTGSVTLSGLPTGNWILTRTQDGLTVAGSGTSTAITSLFSGTYNYTVTNSSGCISPLSNTIVINNQPATPSAPVANAQSFLASANATILDLDIVSPGTPKWYTNAFGGTAIANTALLSTAIYYGSQTNGNGCESTNRTAVNVAVYPDSVGGSVSGTTTVCYGSNSTVLTLSGYTGSILKWQSSTVSDFSANVNDINIQSTTYTATNLTAPLYYRAAVQSGTPTIDYSSPAFIDVTPQSVGGNLSGSTSICLGQNSGLLTLIGNNGTILRWEQSVDNGLNWTSISNTSNTFTSGALTTTTQYRVVIQNGGCPAVFSSVATITVKNTPVVTDFPNQQVCFGDTKTFGDPFVAGYDYAWSSNLGYSSVLPQVNITFDQVVTQTYTYTVTNTTTGCSVQDQFQVIVNPLPNAPVIANTAICAGDTISIGANSTIGSTYSWSSVPAGFTSTSSNPSVNPAVTTAYILEEKVTATGCKKSNQVTISIQPIPVITIVGAPQIAICETTSQVQLNATITNPYSSFVWTKLIGSGSFDDNTSLNPIYSPSPADIAAGSVSLQLSVIGANPCTATYTENIVIKIDKKTIANAGSDVITCGTNPIQINATGTLNATNLVWSLPPGISGILDQSNPYIPIFTPSTNDINYAGSIVISLTASSNTSCPSDSDEVSVLITPAPVVDAGPPTALICEGSNYSVPVNSATTQKINNTSVLWTKGTGDGTIVGANSLTPTYIPGVNDILNGSVTLTLSAAGNNPCSTPATDNIIISIVKKPIANAGPDTTVCQGTINVNATIQNAGSILWTVQNGNGNFVDPTAISPIYVPALSDLNTTVTFTATVAPVNNCGPIVSDSVLYTINANPTVTAAGDATICQSNSSYQLQATATNTTSITWTSTGSGSFDNIHNEDPIYTLSPNDIVAGSVTFTITGTQANCTDATDTMVLTIQKNPTANAGTAQVICQGDMIVIPGTSTNSSSFSWVRNGGTGSFINANTTNPTYISQGSESGTIYLTLIANAIAPCTVPANSDSTITIIPKATADAGNDAQICEGATYQITTATASNNVSVQWNTNGDGTFTGGNTISPVYTPGPSDNNNGTVTLTLVAEKNYPCNANAVDAMTLTINKIPTITVINPDVNLCVGDPSYIITGVVPINYDSLKWTTSGSGTFAPNDTAVAPTYFPSASDYTLGTVTLTLTASRNPLNCNSSTSNTITLHFISKPTADAGPTNATICEGSFYVTNGAAATNYTNLTWSSSGSGSFTNATTLLASYTPSAADYNLGFVDLTLTVNPLNPCSGAATDVIRLDLQKLPVITLKGDDAICVTQNSYAIGGTSVTDYALNSEVWASSGTGTFSPSGDSLNPIYHPSTDDLTAGFVTLTLTVNSIAPCVVPVQKSFVLTFQKLPVATAGPNLTECDTPFHITTATATLSTVSTLVWSTSGTGTFDYKNILDPIYTPSTFDAANSPITLTLTANPIAPCASPLVTTTSVNITKSPVVTVSNQLPICEDATNTTIIGTTVDNKASFIWTSATGTTIENNTTLNPIVTPSAQDIINNQIILTITAQPVAPCTTPVSKTVIVPIQKKPIVFSGASQTICEGTIITTSDASSSNVTNLHWDNNGGDGTFTTSNTNTVSEYTPGANEIAAGQVLLTLIGDAVAPCSGTVTSTITYTIVKNPIVTINPTEVTICETETSYTLPSSMVTLVYPTSIASYQWSTTNMASLTGANTWTPTYTPNAADIAAGFVNLTLTVNPIAPCATPIIRTLKINIAKQASIDFTNEGYFCEGISKPLSANFANYDPASISWTIVNGTGTITGANTATPTYVPASDSGTIVIRISVESLTPCTNTVTKDFTITVVKKPIVAMTTTTNHVCSSQLTYALSGNTAQFGTNLLWTRVNPVGTGTFSNPTSLNPEYTFNAADIANGFVTLRLTATSDANCSLTDSKEITINITKAPSVLTVPTDTVCQDSAYAASATATNNASVLWSTAGTSNGSFTNANQLVSSYTPGTNDLNSFTIQVTAVGNGTCASVSATKTVTVQQKPILDAGLENRFNCSSEPYQITDVTGQNLGTILWTSNSGAPGTFSNDTSLNPIYTPSATELASGNPIILTVTAQAIAPCTTAISDFIVLNLTPNQVVDAGTYTAICEGSNATLVGSATNASSVYWTSNGTGTFSAVNSLNTDYVPSNADVINGTITLSLHAISNTNCPEVVDSTTITILKNPSASAGAAASICEGSSYTLAAGEASANNYTSLSWSATGPGALDLATINTLTPTYIPAVGQTGTVTLTLTATGFNACGINAVSEKTITIVPKPFVTIPSTKTICEGTTLTLNNTDVSAINYSNLQWASSNGLGTFTPNNGTATIYTPAAGQTGMVTLSLNANSLNGVCPSYTSSLQLDIIAKPIVEAGTNGTICQTEPYTVTGASVQNSNFYSWSVSGAAIIQAGTETTLSPVIIPNPGATGTVTVTLTAVGNGICPTVVSDFLTIQINPTLIVDAGADGSLCEGANSFQLNGTVTNATAYIWTTTGGGIIQQTGNPLAPLYIPSASDFNTTTGTNVITITLNATTTTSCSSASDSVQLTLYAKPKINAGSDLLACHDNTSVLLNGATVSNFNSTYTISWSSSGNGTWDYTNSNGGINPVYIFGTNDTSSVTLTMSALPDANCPQVAIKDSMVVTIHQNPSIVTSSYEITMCGETFTLPDLVTVNNSAGILWINTTAVSGTPGTFTNATTETPIFTPSANEIANGFVLLTMTATPISGCAVPASTVIRVNLQPKAIVNAGNNITACQGEVVAVDNNASVENYTTYSWSENGTGSIDTTTINTLHPKYYPGTNETGVVTFTLQATNLAPCPGLVTKTMTLTIAAQPTVNAGPDATICQNSNYTLGNATVTNSTDLLWDSSQNSNGTSNPTYVKGTFSNPTIINPSYTPSQDDINLGYVYLTVKAANTTCNSLVSDVIKITIKSATTVAAGSNTTICEGTNFTLAEASQSNAASLVWTSSQNSNGTSSPTYVSGSFSSTTLLNPIYTPSLDDINLGHVYLTLTATGDSSCPIASSQMELTIVKKPTVSTTDVSMCMNTPQISLNGMATNYQSLNWSIYSGPGSMSPNAANPLSPTFTSGISGLNTVQTTVVRLYVTPNTGCPQTSAIYDDLEITIQPLPTVEAGTNGSVCYVSGQPIVPFAITGSSVTNGGSQNWTTSGVGVFNLGNPVLYQSLSNSCTSDILTLTANGIGACATSSVSDSVRLTINCTVPNSSTITSTAPTTICQGTTATYSIPVNSNIQNYSWSVPNGATIQSGQGTNTIDVLYTNTAISGNIAVTISNGCGSAISSLPVIVTSLPSGVTISGPQIVCAGSSTTFTASTIANADEYVWTLPNGSTISTTTNTITIPFSLTDVSGNLSVRGKNTCSLGASSTNYGITVISQPTLSSSITPSAICSNTVFSYVPTSATTGSSFAWTRAVQSGISNSASSGSSTINETLVNTTSNVVAVEYVITITTSEGCTKTQSVFVNVNPAPSLTSTQSPNPICSGSTFSYTPTFASTGTNSWVRNAKPGISEIGTNGSGTINEVLTNTTSSPITVTYLLTIPTNSYGCSNTAPTQLNVVVNPIPQVTVNSIILCANSSQMITATPNVSGNYSYAWTVPAGVTNPGNINSFSINTAGTYSVTITDNITNCSSLNTSITTTNISVPTVTLNSETICQGTSTILTATSGTSGNYDYVWTVPKGATNPGNATSITSGIAGTYSVIITDNTTSCSSVSTSGSIIINPLPVVTVNSPTVCSGSNATVTATPSTIGNYAYNWTVPAGASNPGNVASFSTAVAGNYSVVITNTATNCFSSNATGTVTVNPLPIVTLNSETICQGNSVVLNATPNLPGNYSYSWIVPSGANNPGNTSNTLASVAGTYSVTITNLATNCTSTMASGTLTVIPLPIVNITNPNPICYPNTVDLTSTTSGSSSGLTFSYWNNSAATIAIANPDAVSISGTYYIKGTNSNGCYTIKPVLVEKNPLPTATITGQNSFIVCQNGSQPTITFTGSNGTAPYIFSYQINSEAIQTVASSASNASASIAFPTSAFGNHTLTLVSVQDSSSSQCSSSTIQLPNTTYVEVQQVGTITPLNQVVVSQTVCQASSITPIVFTIGGAATNAYATNLPNGLIGNYNSGTFIISGSPLVSGIFNYEVHTSGSTNGCNSIYSGTITVNSNDEITVLVPATINQSVCANEAIQPIVYSLGGGATGGTVSFYPSTPIGISWSISNNILTISGATSNTGNYGYTVQSFGICGQSTASGNLSINSSATVTLVSGNPNTTVCIGTSIATPIQYSINPTKTTMLLSGALPTGVQFNAATGLISGTPTQSGSFPYTVSGTSGCGNVLSGAITVNPLQSIAYVSGNTNQVACQFSPIDPINFLVSTDVNAVTVTPAFPAGIVYSISNGILTVSGTPTAATSLAQNYTITTQGTCGPAANYSITFDIHPEGTITFTTGSGATTQAVCQSSAIVPITFTIGGGATGIVTPTLPEGLSLTFDSLTQIYTIQGNPLVNGIYNFPITTTGCPKTNFITISNVNSSVGITLTSSVGTDDQTLCQTNFNSPINPVIYNVIGATNVVVNGLPTGVTAIFSPTTGQLIISGTPIQSGVFNYSITSLPCSIVKAGVIKISTPIFITNEVVTNVSCNSNNDGAIAITIVGGVSFNGLYAVHWSGPNGFQQNLTTITGLQPGTYVLTGTDAIGCPIPTKTYTVLPAAPIAVSLQSSTNVSCNGTLGCANFNITGGSGIYTLFSLEYLDPSSQTLRSIIPANNNYYNICNLQSGLYYLTVKDSKNCTSTPYLFTIYDYSSLAISNISMDSTLCQGTPGKIRIKVNSLDPNLTFYYNNLVVPSVDLGNSTYELSIDNPTAANGIVKVKNGQNCWVTKTVSSTIAAPDFTFTSSDFVNYGYFSVNGSIELTNSVNINNIPTEHDYIVWDFGDNTPFKVFYNPTDLLPNSNGENFEKIFHTYTANGIYQITLTVYNQFGCSKTVTKTITIGSGATMMFPTIFTPNNDGINDYFRPSLIGIKELSMYIYDNWGNLVYELSSETAFLTADWGWNGIEKGKKEPINNNYRYYIIATSINNDKIEKEGAFLLIK